MAGITDNPFRSFMKSMGCGIITTELISAKALQMKHKKSHQLMTFDESQRPIGIQIFGEELESLGIAAQMVEQAGADFIDLNFGCPVTKIIKKGAGSAVLKDLNFLQQILKKVCKSVNIPVSIKVRTGWDSHSRNANQVTQIAHDEGIAWVTIHGRTRAQGYSGNADWDYISEVKTNSLIPIIGNGDLITVDRILRLQKTSQCDGMMIGRACLKNPWIFLELKQGIQNNFHQKTNESNNTNNMKHLASMKKNHIKTLTKLRYYLENFYDEPMCLLQYKKLCVWYSSGYPNSAQFRQEVFKTRERNQILDLIESYFSKIDLIEKQSTIYDPALMQGHG